MSQTSGHVPILPPEVPQGQREPSGCAAASICRRRRDRRHHTVSNATPATLLGCTEDAGHYSLGHLCFGVFCLLLPNVLPSGVSFNAHLSYGSPRAVGKHTRSRRLVAAAGATTLDAGDHVAAATSAVIPARPGERPARLSSCFPLGRCPDT